MESSRRLTENERTLRAMFREGEIEMRGKSEESEIYIRMTESYKEKDRRLIGNPRNNKASVWPLCRIVDFLHLRSNRCEQVSPMSGSPDLPQSTAGIVSPSSPHLPISTYAVNSRETVRRYDIHRPILRKNTGTKSRKGAEMFLMVMICYDQSIPRRLLAPTLTSPNRKTFG